MQPPPGVTTYESEVATLWFEADGILVSLSKSPRRTVENLGANIALVKKITGGKKPPLLIYLSPSPVPDKAARAFAAEQLPHVYKAMAMVSSSGLGKLIMNFLFALKPPTIPMKSFADEGRAREWLRQFLA